MQISAAYGAAFDPQPHLARPRLGVRTLLPPQRLTGSVQHHRVQHRPPARGFTQLRSTARRLRAWAARCSARRSPAWRRRSWRQSRASPKSRVTGYRRSLFQHHTATALFFLLLRDLGRDGDEVSVHRDADLFLFRAWDFGTNLLVPVVLRRVEADIAGCAVQQGGAAAQSGQTCGGIDHRRSSNRSTRVSALIVIS